MAKAQLFHSERLVSRCDQSLNAYAYLLNRLVQLNYTVDRPNGQLRRDIPRTRVGDDGGPVRLGRGLNIGSLAFGIGRNHAAIGLGGSLDVRSLAFGIGCNHIAVRLGWGLSIGSLAFGVGCDHTAIGLGGSLDVRGLTLKDGALNGGLEAWLSR